MKTMTLINYFTKLSILFALMTLHSVRAEEGVAVSSVHEAYEKGRSLHWQYKQNRAKAYLKYAADNGHIEAAFMYSEILSVPSLVQSEEESKYALMAAKSGHLLAMLKMSLSSSIVKDVGFWRTKAERYFLKHAKDGNSDAMRYLYSFYPESDERSYYWLKKASEEGNPKAMYMLARRYDGRYGWFIIPGSRDKEIRRLYMNSAKAGYPPAMAKYASLLAKDSKTKKEAFQWMLKGVEIGKAQSLPFIAYIYTENPDMREVVPRDNVKAAGYLKAYLDVMAPEPNSSSYEIALEDYEKLLKVMTEPEKQQANKFAQDYLSTHTVRAFDDFWEWGVDYGVRTDIN